MIRTSNELLLSGAITALQTQAKANIHIGGHSALGQLGVTHYLQVNSKDLPLFAKGQFTLPIWFTKNNWDFEAQLCCTT